MLCPRCGYGEVDKPDKLRSALKMIYTWAEYDREQGLLTEDRALHNKHVMELCEKALNG